MVVATTKWDLVDDEHGNEREKELSDNPKYFGAIIKAGATMVRYTKGEQGLRIVKAIAKQHERIPRPTDEYIL